MDVAQSNDPVGGVGWRGQHGVGVVVDGRDGGYLRGEGGVDGEIAGLCGGLRGDGDKEDEDCQEWVTGWGHRFVNPIL